MRTLIAGNVLALLMTFTATAYAERRGGADPGTVVITETMKPERSDFTCNTGGPTGLAVAAAALGLVVLKRRR